MLEETLLQLQLLLRLLMLLLHPLHRGSLSGNAGVVLCAGCIKVRGPLVAELSLGDCPQRCTRWGILAGVDKGLQSCHGAERLQHLGNIAVGLPQAGLKVSISCLDLCTLIAADLELFLSLMFALQCFLFSRSCSLDFLLQIINLFFRIGDGILKFLFKLLVRRAIPKILVSNERSPPGHGACHPPGMPCLGAIGKWIVEQAFQGSPRSRRNQGHPLLSRFGVKDIRGGRAAATRPSRCWHSASGCLAVAA
mmetsp:Transcript_8540/g.21911  ORF Transcript_8540/g.21911 Transcript_8540/m.21911 type:complete len:251 (+) Transcript_8540:181-933(+)